MKKYTKLLGVIAVVIIMVSCLSGCNFILGKLGFGGTFKLENSAITLKIGEIYTVNLSPKSINESFKLTSSDEEKVQVIDDVKLKGLGKTSSAVTVTATSYSGKTATISVTVDYAELGSLSLTSSGGEKIQLLNDDEEITPIVFTAEVDAGVNPADIVSWKVRESGKEENVATHTGTVKENTFTFTPPSRAVLYEVTVEVGSMSVTEECGVFNKVYISSDKSKYKVGSEVKLDLYLKPSSGITGNQIIIDVYYNGTLKYNDMAVTISDNGILKKAEIELGTINNIGTYEITVNYEGDTSNIFTLTVADYVATDHIYVAADNTLLHQKSTSQTVEFTSTVSPAGANPDAIEWYVNNIKMGEGSDFSFRPTTGVYGEYHVVAISDKLQSETITIVYLPTTDNRWNYADTFTTYGASEQNRYITSQEELNAVVVYALENQKYGSTANSLKLYVDFLYAGSISDAIDKARLSSAESGIIAGYTKTEESDGKQISLSFSYDFGNTRINNSPSSDAGTDSTPQSTDSIPHYKTGNYTRNYYIDSCDKTMTVTNSNLLYKAVSWGLKPVFENNSNGVLLQQIYDNARDVLSKICTDDMTEYEKVHAIYDWIVYNVRYDYDLAERDSSGDKYALNENMKYYGYYLEGIFLDKFYTAGNCHAVCDGKSKAFVLMCSIEGINSLRIAGKVSAGGHAWNKVLLDPDDDGVKNWFVIDTTWGDYSLNVSGQGRIAEYLTHGYFMVNDSTISLTHVEDDRGYPEADGDYDYYTNTTFTYGTSTYNLNIENKLGGLSQVRKLQYLLTWAKKNGLKYVEFKYEGTLTSATMTTAANAANVQLKYTTPFSVRSSVYGIVIN